MGQQTNPEGRIAELEDAENHSIAHHDAGGAGWIEQVVNFEVTGDEFVMTRASEDPHGDPTEVRCEIDQKTINQYALTETSSKSKHGRLSGYTHSGKLVFIVRDEDEWLAFRPFARQYAQTDSNSDYRQTQVPGVKVNDLSPDSRGRDVNRGKKRYKISRELVTEYDQVWMVAYKDKSGGSINGSYSKIKNAKATRLEVSE